MVDQEHPQLFSIENKWIPTLARELEHLLSGVAAGSWFDWTGSPSEIYDAFLPQLSYRIAIAPNYRGRGASEDIIKRIFTDESPLRTRRGVKLERVGHSVDTPEKIDSDSGSDSPSLTTS